MMLPLWEPLVGNIVIIFTLLLPIGYAGLWVAYGIFLLWNQVVFLMASIVVVTFVVFFIAEILSIVSLCRLSCVLLGGGWFGGGV